MNQILSVSMPNSNKKNKKKASINSVVLFFCIVLLIFGISIFVIGIVSKNQGSSNSSIASVSEPKIEIIPGASVLNITVTGQSYISNVVYKWNDGEENQVNGVNDNTLKLELNIPVGTNILEITATDENGKTKTYQGEFTGVEKYKPTIELVQKENQGIMVIRYSSESIVKQVSYYFDNNEPKNVEVNDLSGEVPINLMGGKHNFSVELTNESGQKYLEEHELNAPTVSVVTDGEKFIINIEDTSENGIVSVLTEFNGERNEKTIDNLKTYEDSINLKDGENKLIIMVKNSENALVTKKVRFSK